MKRVDSFFKLGFFKFKRFHLSIKLNVVASARIKNFGFHRHEQILL